MAWIIIVGVWLIAFVMIYWGVRSGAFRKKIEVMKEVINDFKGASWTGKIVVVLVLGIFIVGYFAFRLWIG